MVTLRARQLPLPASEKLWEARTAKEWNAERLNQGTWRKILVLCLGNIHAQTQIWIKIRLAWTIGLKYYTELVISR